MGIVERTRVSNLLVVALTLTWSGLAAAQAVAPRVRLTFIPAADSLRASAADYEGIWAAEGERMVAVMERVSGLRFVTAQYADTVIPAAVAESPSNSGFRGESGLRLRASYTNDTKRATLVHELGHRLMAGLLPRGEEPHAALFLWLYDAWSELYGTAWADAQVAIERERGARYVVAWDAATALSATERERRWRALLAERLPERR